MADNVITRNELRTRLLPVLEELRALLTIAPDKAVRQQLHWAMRSANRAVRLCNEPPKPQADTRTTVTVRHKEQNPQAARYPHMR